jgi:flagellar basal-body rod protein FlgB
MRIQPMGQSNGDGALFGVQLDEYGLKSLVHILNATSDRQKITTSNIANVNTPGYTAKDVSFAELIGQMDSPFETKMAQQAGGSHAQETDTGNPVNLQKELLDMQKNLLFYNMAVRRISTVITGLKSAAQVGR